MLLFWQWRARVRVSIARSLSSCTPAEQRWKPVSVRVIISLQREWVSMSSGRRRRRRRNTEANEVTAPTTAAAAAAG